MRRFSRIDHDNGSSCQVEIDDIGAFKPKEILIYRTIQDLEGGRTVFTTPSLVCQPFEFFGDIEDVADDGETLRTRWKRASLSIESDDCDENEG